MSTDQTRYMAKLNKLRALQQQVSFWEYSMERYKQTCDLFRDYIDCLREFGDIRAIINAYVRMAQYCERMDDKLLSRELLKDAKKMMINFKLGTNELLLRMQRKIDSLRYYF